MRERLKRIYIGKYQKTIYLWTSIFFILAQILFSTTILVQTNKQDIKNNYAMNEQIFRQVEYNVRQSDQAIRNLCKSLFLNAKISRMLYGTMQEEDIYEWIVEFQSICDPILLSNPLIQSIYVYNRGMDRLFSSYRYLNYEDEDLLALLENSGELSVLKPQIRTIYNPNSKTQTSKVITYILFDAVDETGKPEGAVVINVNFDNFIAEVRQLLTFSEEEESEIFLFQQGELIGLDEITENGSTIVAEVQNMVNGLQFPQQQPFFLETRNISGEKYGIFFTNIPDMEWTMVKLQSYDDVYSNVIHQKMVIVAVSVVFCVIMLMLIYFLAKKIYSPIGQLVEKVREKESEDSAEVGDIEYLNHAYENLFRKASERRRNGSQEKILLTYNLRTLFIDGDKTNEAVWKSLQSIDKQLFQKENSFGIGILRIDNYRKFQERYDYKNQELYKFVIENIFTEILDNHGYRSAVVSVEEDKMAVLMHGDPSKEGYRRDIEECFRLTNENLNKFAKISFSMALSAYQQGIEALPEMYRRTESMLSYRYVLGKEALIFDDYEADQGEAVETGVLMKQLNHHIQEGMKEDISEDFALLTCMIRKQDREGLVQFIAGLAIDILHMIDTREKNNHVYVGSVFIERYTAILSMETWDEISDRLQKMISEVLSSNDKQAQKANLLVDTILNIVQDEYENTNLCLTKISEMVKMSAQYVGRIFKGSTGISVSEYINEYRLKKSIDIMTETGCTVNEVMEQVGIENESQYYRLFKKKYGDTPKAYMMKQMTEDKATKEL